MDLLSFCIINLLYIYPFIWTGFNLLNYFIWNWENFDNTMMILLACMLQLCLRSGITINKLDKFTKNSFMIILLYYIFLLIDKILIGVVENNSINPFVCLLLIFVFCYHFFLSKFTNKRKK